MKVLLLIVIALILPSSIFAQNQIYVIPITESGNGVLASAYVSSGYVSNVPGQYRYSLFDANGTVLDTFGFSFERSIEYHMHIKDSSGVRTEYEQFDVPQHLLIATYFPSGDHIRLSNPDGSTLADIDVSLYSTCDGICQENDVCALDCPASQQPTTEEVMYVPVIENSLPRLLVMSLGILAIIASIIALIVHFRHINREE